MPGKYKINHHRFLGLGWREIVFVEISIIGLPPGLIHYALQGLSDMLLRSSGDQNC